MAPTLTSNSSFITSTPHSRVTLRNPRLRVFAKKSGSFPSFGLGKPKDDSSSAEEKDNSSNSNPFRLDFGKIPDVTSLIPVPSNTSAPGFSFGNTRRKDPSIRLFWIVCLYFLALQPLNLVFLSSCENYYLNGRGKAESSQLPGATYSDFIQYRNFQHQAFKYHRKWHSLSTYESIIVSHDLAIFSSINAALC